MNEIIQFNNPHELFAVAARNFMERAVAAVKTKGLFSVVLSGGHTPELFFDSLTTDEYYKKNIPWQNIQFFFADERYVPHENINSNYHTAYEHLFSRVPINVDNIYPIPTDKTDPVEAAKLYEQALRKALQITDDALPQFDVIYLGLGENAHTASLMPLSDVVIHYANNKIKNKNPQLAASLWVAEQNMYRITLTPPVINNSLDIIFFVTGENKAIAVWKVLEGPYNPENYPAQLIQSARGKTFWYLDNLAARKLHVK